uniref:Uncharacterized LOC111665669 n=1 Tax=Seriola lalandi dorsalis TaxID=1841481 RepID=A0A3B4YAB0_SERLL
MARAETIESVRETGGGGNGPLPPQNTCRMELPRPFHTWPGLLTTTTMTTGSDSDREEHQEASSQQGPLPDLLPQNEHPSWASLHHRAPRREAVQEMGVRRVASQLRAIGDEYNARVLHRQAAPHWQDWRDACRGLFNFVTQTLSTLYRLT